MFAVTSLWTELNMEDGKGQEWLHAKQYCNLCSVEYAVCPFGMLLYVLVSFGGYVA